MSHTGKSATGMSAMESLLQSTAAGVSTTGVPATGIR